MFGIHQAEFRKGRRGRGGGRGEGGGATLKVGYLGVNPENARKYKRKIVTKRYDGRGIFEFHPLITFAQKVGISSRQAVAACCVHRVFVVCVEKRVCRPL